MEMYHLKGLVEKYGYRVMNIEPVTTGKFNRSYEIAVEPVTREQPAINRVLLRIAPPADTGFIYYERRMMHQEPDLHQVIRKETRLPVPRIYHYDFTGESIAEDFLIMEFMEGKPLSAVSLDQNAHDQVMQQTGKFLAELHQNCRSDSYGYLGEHHCMEPQQNWQSAFRVMWQKMIEDNQHCGVYDPEEASMAITALERHLDLFEYQQPAALLHMDIWGQNILVSDSGEITAILDWDRALWGDPEIEYAVLDYCGFNNEAFWEGYGNAPTQTEAFRIRRIFYHLYETQKYQIIWTLRRPDYSGVESYKSYALKALKRLV